MSRRHLNSFTGSALLAAAALCCAPAGAQQAPSMAQLLQQALAMEHGEGVPKDQIKAAALYCDAARRGSAEAQYALGWMYANGRGVAHDDTRAAVLFAMAAAQGQPDALRAQRFFGDAVGPLPDCMQPKKLQSAAAGNADWQGLAGLDPQKQKIVELVRQLAPQYAVQARLALAVIAVESNFQTGARSPKNAQGLMQLIPETAQRFKVKNVLDAADNIKGGLSYLRWLLSYYRGRVDLAVAAYNAGEGAVDRYHGVPPYRETQEYVRKVRRIYHQSEHPFDDSLTDPSPALARISAGVM